MRKRNLILLWLLVILIGVLASSWWISKYHSHEAQIEELKSQDTIKVTIVGEVAKPQIANLPVGTTFRQALAYAGGITPYSTRNVSTYVPNEEGSHHRIDLKDESQANIDPVLKDGSIVMARVQVLYQNQHPIGYRIFGRKKLNLEQITEALEPLIEAEFVKNYWAITRKNLDIRYVSGRFYRLFSIVLPEEIPPKTNSDDKMFSYLMLVQPAADRHLGPSPSTRKLIDALSKVVDGELVEE